MAHSALFPFNVFGVRLALTRRGRFRVVAPGFGFAQPSINGGGIGMAYDILRRRGRVLVVPDRRFGAGRCRPVVRYVMSRGKLIVRAEPARGAWF